MPLPTFRLIENIDEYMRVMMAAQANDHNINYLTHVAERNGEIIGAASVGNIPLVWIWAHTQKMKARDSISMLPVVDKVIAERGHKRAFFACNQNSPYHSHMARLGFTLIPNTELFSRYI